MTRTSDIKKLIMELIKLGFTDKSEIYTEILKQHPEYKRPEVRRACRDLRMEIKQIYDILNKDVWSEDSPCRN